MAQGKEGQQVRMWDQTKSHGKYLGLIPKGVLEIVGITRSELFFQDMVSICSHWDLPPAVHLFLCAGKTKSRAWGRPFSREPQVLVIGGESMLEPVQRTVKRIRSIVDRAEALSETTSLHSCYRFVQRILAQRGELIAMHSNKAAQAIRRCDVCQGSTNKNKIKLAKSRSAFFFFSFNHHAPPVPNT